jgi:hypothetical protein
MSHLEVVLSALQVVQGAAGGDNWRSDQVTYPNDLERIDPSLDLQYYCIPFAHFEYNIADWVGEGHDTRASVDFVVEGYFSATNDEVTDLNRVMANCVVSLYSFDSPTRAFDSFSFNAEVEPTPFGTPEEPEIEWHVHGRFDPASFGDVDYDVSMRLNQWGQLWVVSSRLNDTGYFSTAQIEPASSGFSLTLLQH